MQRTSRIEAPAITGIASRKLNSAAAAGPRPPHRAAHTVDPERETPRNTAATACANPIPTATPTVGSGRLALSRRVDPFLKPVTRNPVATNTQEAAALTFRWDKPPTTPPGNGARTTSP